MSRRRFTMPGKRISMPRRRFSIPNWLGLYAAVFFAFLHLPLVTLSVFSFNSSRFTVWEHFSLAWYQAIFRDPQLLEGAWNSTVIALVSTALSTAMGTVCAYGLWKRRSSLLTGALYLSLVTPEIVTGISLLALFQWSFRWLGLQLGMFTVILAHVSFSLAYVVIVIAARLRNIGPALEEAAMDLGATEWQAFVHVMLPALAPGIVAAALLALTVSFDDYVITSMVAGVDSQTLPMVFYAMARRGASPVMNAISALITAFFGVLIVLSERVRGAGLGPARELER
jgi:spermidine/putrescine transport system permease protein